MKNAFIRLRRSNGFTVLAVLTVILSAVYSTSAGTEHWIGPTTDSNWTTASNWTGVSPAQTYFNDVDFIDNGGNTNLSVFSVDNIFPGASGVAQCPIYRLRMYPTNRNFTTLIEAGVALYTGAGAGDLYVGADSLGGLIGSTTNRGQANLQETITFEGAGALLAVTGTLHVGQGLTNAVQTVPASTNYVTLNMSGLDNFAMMPSIADGTKIQGITVSNAATGSAASRFLLCGQLRPYSQGAIYLAKTNIIVLGNDMEIGAMSTYSNSMPCPVYLGQSNSILVGNNGAANGLVTVGSRGNTNAFLTFNPAFLGGPTPPSASFASPATINGGRVTTFYICLATGGVIPAYGYADFTGGNVTVMASTLQLGTAGTNGINALGVLTFDNGVFNVNNVTNGYQSISAGGAGVGIINLNANATYDTNAMLVVNNILMLGAAAGTLNPATAGTLNINGGTLTANAVTNGRGAATVNMTNGAWNVSLVSTNATNMTLTAFHAGGGINLINITSILGIPGSAPPLRYHLISAPTITGASSLALSLPAGYIGSLDATSNPQLVDFVLNAGPAAPRILTWTGANSGNWDTVSVNWLTGGAPTSYDQHDAVSFTDAATGSPNVNLTETLTPYSLTVSNSALAYTLGGSGLISGTTGLTKTGTNSLTLDDTGGNNFTGGVTINNGIVVVGNQDNHGNLGAGPVSIPGASGVLYFNRGAQSTISNIISGSGAVIQGGGDTLKLAASNTYTGSTVVSAGTLALSSPGNISSSVAINIASGATLNAGGTLTLPSGQTLEGGGNITGALVSGVGSSVAPGTTNTVGTLTVSGAISLGGFTTLKLSGATNDVLSSASSISYGGTLVVSNISTNALSVGATFTFFQATNFGGSFATLTLPPLGTGQAWNTTNLSVNGTLSVVSTNTGAVPLTILQQPSSELSQPLGSNVELCIMAQSSASTNLQYQWLRNGVIILPTDTNFDGVTNSCLEIPEFQATDSGAFSVEVADGVSVVVSQPAEVTADIPAAPGEDTVEAAYALPPSNQFTIISSNTNAVKEAGTPDIIAGDPGGSEIWFQWSPPPAGSNGIVTFSTLGSGFNTTMGAYTGSSASNLTQVPTVINDHTGAGYVNSRINFYAVQGTTYLIAVDGFYGAQGNVVLSWSYYPGSDTLPDTTNTPLVIVSSNNATVILNDPWPGSDCDWFLDGRLVAANQTSLTINNLSTNSVGTYIASYTTPDNLITVYSEPIQVQINIQNQQNGSADTSSVIWNDFLNATNNAFVLPTGGGAGQVIKLDTSGYSESQAFNTTGSNGVIASGITSCPFTGDCPAWYSFVPPASGLLEVSTIGSGFPAILAVYGSSRTTPLYTNYYAGTWTKGNNPEIYFPASQNVTYSIVVEGISSGQGSKSAPSFAALGTPYPSSGVVELGVFLSQTAQNMSVTQSGNSVTISWSKELSGNLYCNSNPVGAASTWTNLGNNSHPTPANTATSYFSAPLAPGPDNTYTTTITGSQSQFFYFGGSAP